MCDGKNLDDIDVLEDWTARSIKKDFRMERAAKIRNETYREEDHERNTKDIHYGRSCGKY